MLEAPGLNAVGSSLEASNGLVTAWDFLRSLKVFQVLARGPCAWTSAPVGRVAPRLQKLAGTDGHWSNRNSAMSARGHHQHHWTRRKQRADMFETEVQTALSEEVTVNLSIDPSKLALLVWRLLLWDT